VNHRAKAVAGLTTRQTASLEAEASVSVWSGLRELEPLVAEGHERLWRISLPPTASAQFRARLLSAAPSPAQPRAFFDWGGGLLWCVLPASLAASDVHRLAQDAGGHARLVRSASTHQGADLDEAVDQAFSPLDGANRAVHERLKIAFDPTGVLNPGRMYAGL